MKKIFPLYFCCLLFTCFSGITGFSQKDKLTGHWKIIMTATDETGELDANYFEQAVYKGVKAKRDSAGTKIDAEDSAAVKKVAKEAIDEFYSKLYLQLNPDETCVWNFKSIEDGALIKGKYKINEDQNSLTLIMNKDQSFLAKDEKIKGRKIVFYYTFKDNVLRLNSDDGTLRIHCTKD